ncbi:hypothetical protein LCGC14_1032370 [marine sediment metagenome]|uniref:Uncharacterized protein n=1 Tax=marine sediment metagenome TaxID=412755 RepID=A0A0F9QCC9_9ZZZZ
MIRLDEFKMNDGFFNTIDEKECFIIDDDYHFKWRHEDGAYHFSITSYFDTIDFDDLMVLRIDMGMAVREIINWFNKSRQPHWDAYLSHDQLGYVTIEANSVKELKVVTYVSLQRQ